MFVCKYMYMCMRVPREVKRWPWKPWGLSCRHMCATWVLGTELRLSGRVTIFLDHSAISLECCYVAQEPFPDY